MDFSATLSKWRSTERALAEWLGQWELPIGVFVGPDDISRTVAQMCRARGWRVPQDVAIIAGNNEETICEYARPTLTSIEPDYKRVGYQAAALLDRLMAEKAKRRTRKSGKSNQPTAPEHIFSPPQGLVVRESTDFFTSDNPEIAQAQAFIAANSHRPIRVGDVAEAVHLETRFLDDFGLDRHKAPAVFDVVVARLVHAFGILVTMLIHPTLQGGGAARFQNCDFIPADSFLAEDFDLLFVLQTLTNADTRTETNLQRKLDKLPAGRRYGVPAGGGDTSSDSVASCTLAPKMARNRGVWLDAKCCR